MIDRRELLRKESEQTRLLKEIPGVIPDTELVAEGNLSSLLPANERKEADDMKFNEMAQYQARYSTHVSKEYIPKRTSSAAEVKFNRSAADNQAIDNEPMKLICKRTSEGLLATDCNNASKDEDLATADCNNASKDEVHKVAGCVAAAESDKKGSGVALHDDWINGDDCATENNGKEETPVVNQSSSTPQIIDIDDDDNENKKTEIIDLDDDDEDDDAVPVTLPAPVERKTSRRKWNYLDPFGKVQGPFKLEDLKLWRMAGWFDDDFKIWNADQSQDEAILLIDVLRQNS